tara:strand:+ start:3367 stop:4299 length:933 start_codon:yes stop_codon:yes gene_type:complete
MRNRSLVTILVGCSTLLHGCQDGQSDDATYDLPQLVTQLTEKARDDLAFIEGGTFIMGDFGAVGEDGVWRPYFPATIEEDQPHKVILSSYSLSKYKTTWHDFDTYLLANDLPLIERGLSKTWERNPFEQDPNSRLFVHKAARVTWQDAKNYCQWVGSLTGLALDLPTSAQWEFAGRNRGSNDWIYSTHDGQPLSAHPELSERVRDTGEYVPVGSRLPPNPLGIYDMADNGMEWVNDWFSETWYRENPEITDPQGPAEGNEKIVRNMDFSFSRIGMPESLPSAFNEEWDSISEYTFRCALQDSRPLAQITP